MAKRGFFARLFGIPAGKPKPSGIKKPAAKPQGPREMTPDRAKLIREAMRVQGEIREQLGEDEIRKMAKAITGDENP